MPTDPHAQPAPVVTREEMDAVATQLAVQAPMLPMSVFHDAAVMLRNLFDALEREKERATRAAHRSLETQYVLDAVAEEANDEVGENEDHITQLEQENADLRAKMERAEQKAHLFEIVAENSYEALTVEQYEELEELRHG